MEQKPEEKPLPADLKAYVDTVRAMAQTHNLLAQGFFPHSAFGAVDHCITFIKALHSEALKTAAAHPESDLLPELKAFKDELAALIVAEDQLNAAVAAAKERTSDTAQG